MTIWNRPALAGAVAALLLLPFLSTFGAAPAVAAPVAHKHEIDLYKVESTVKLAGVGTSTQGDSPTQSLACSPGDEVLDGMWLVKHVDQYSVTPPAGGLYNDERDVWVQASHPDPGDLRTWDFVFKNKAYGDAQLRLAVTCIDGSTQPAKGHQHQVSVTPLFGGPATTSAHPWESGRFFVDSGPQAWGVCASDQYLVAPGFDLGSSSYRLVGSYPSVSNGNPYPGRAWTWEFAGPSQPATVAVYGRCIDRRAGVAQGHRHAIAMRNVPSADVGSGEESLVPAGYPHEAQYQCDQDFSNLYNYKAMVGFFWMGANWEHTWFVGMEPRLKLRAYTFMNSGPDPAEVRYGAFCVNARTSNPIAP